MTETLALAVKRFSAAQAWLVRKEHCVFIGELLLWLLGMVVILLVNALFVACEFSLVASRASKIQELAENGHPTAPLVQKLKSNMTVSVSGTQLGITLASLALGWIGESSIHELVRFLLELIPGFAGVEPPSGTGVVLSFLILSTLHVVFGEQVPKFLALRMPEKLILTLAPIFRVYCAVAYPFIWCMDKMANGVLSILGVEKVEEKEHAVHSAEELEILIEESRKAGELGERETDLLKRVLDMRDLTVEKVMRKKMDAVAEDATLSQTLAVVSKTKHSRLPVYKGSADNIVGILNTRDMFDTWLALSKLSSTTYQAAVADFKISKVMRPPYKVVKTMAASSLLDELRKRKIQIAVVTDEAGKTVGMITMEDLLEQLVGEIYDEYDKGMSTK